MKLQASRPISPKNLQSQTSALTKNQLAISRLGILHGRLVFRSFQGTPPSERERTRVRMGVDRHNALLTGYRRERYRTLSHRRLGRAAAGDKGQRLGSSLRSVGAKPDVWPRPSLGEREMFDDGPGPPAAAMPLDG